MVIADYIKRPGVCTPGRFGVSNGLAALNGQETVAWVFVNNHSLWQFGNGFWAFVLAKVEDRLKLSTAECYFF